MKMQTKAKTPAPAGNPPKQIKSIDDLPTTTTNQARLRIFQATRRPIFKTQTIETSYGIIRIDGKLGQAHADVLESILFAAEKVGYDREGRIKLLIDPYKIKKMSGQIGGGKIKGKNRLNDILRDIMATVIEISEPSKLRAMGHIIDDVVDSTVAATGELLTRPNPLKKGGKRVVWTVILGKIGGTLLMNDIGIHYNPTHIATLPHGVTQAGARIILTHKSQPNGGWHLDTLISQVCGNIDGDELRNKRREIRSDAEQLRSLGILLRDGRIIKENLNPKNPKSV